MAEERRTESAGQGRKYSPSSGSGAPARGATGGSGGARGGSKKGAAGSRPFKRASQKQGASDKDGRRDRGGRRDDGGRRGEGAKDVKGTSGGKKPFRRDDGRKRAGGASHDDRKRAGGASRDGGKQRFGDKRPRGPKREAFTYDTSSAREREQAAEAARAAAEGEAAEAAPEEKGARKWSPNRTRTVQSKKAFDQQRMERLVSDDVPVYRGELDPRQKDPERKPRSIPFSEQKVMDKAARLAELEQPQDARSRLVTHSDFRDQFEKCEASPGRLAALYATHQVRRRNAYAQEIIEASIDTSRLSAEDRAFATLLTLGVVSTSGALDEIINRAIASPRDLKNDVRDAIRISTYEIVYLKKAPHAAVDQGVELVRAIAPSAANLGNAVLHRILEGSEYFPFGDPTADVEALALLYAFPSWLAKRLIADMGAQAAVKLMQASNEPAPVFVHVNALQATDEEVIALFAEVGAELEPAGSGGVDVPGCYKVSSSRALADGRIQRLFSQGKILVSDASAQAVASAVLEDGRPESVLEVGSGRGTKSIMLQSIAHRSFGEQVELTCMDSHGFKTDLLRDRARTYGADIADFVTGNATRLGAVIGDRSFDTVFVDSPCSGLGTLRRHHEIRWRLQPEQIDDLAEVSLSLLKSAAPHVKPGGRLVYSTCTVTYAENNGVVKAFLESEEGSDFALAPVFGKAAFTSQLESGSPDAHFAAKFVKKK